MTKLTIECISFKPYRKNTLVGFATILVREMRLIVHDVALHERGDARWAALPARPQVHDGALVTNADGKIQYATLMEFSGRDVRDAFSCAVWTAYENFRPP